MLFSGMIGVILVGVIRIPWIEFIDLFSTVRAHARRLVWVFLIAAITIAGISYMFEVDSCYSLRTCTAEAFLLAYIGGPVELMCAYVIIRILFGPFRRDPIPDINNT